MKRGEEHRPVTAPLQGEPLSFPDSIRCAGITPRFPEIRQLLATLPQETGILAYKQRVPLLWVVFLGGTGTGKSTLFNALCGRPVSETGVERPKTTGPVAYVHEQLPIENLFPFPGLKPERAPSGTRAPVAGLPERLLVLTHNLEMWSHLVLVDTPDLDSVQPENRRAAEDLYALSDAVVFVASQEKYADEVPNRILARIPGEERPGFFLLNKAGGTPLEEVETLLNSQGIPIRRDRMWAIAHLASPGPEEISRDPQFSDFLDRFARELSRVKLQDLRRAHLQRAARSLEAGLKTLLTLLEQEERASGEWIRELDRVYGEISGEFIEEHRERFQERTREQMKKEIRRLFSRYDLLAVPRRIVGRLFLTPFRLLGLAGEERDGDHRKTLRKVRQKIDLAPVQRALERLNLAVLERLSPSSEDSPLYGELRRPENILSPDEVRAHILSEQDRLDAWMEETFSNLSRGIPTSRKLGIYTTTFLWGVLIVAFETAVGGGFTVLDAALDSALAPFVTKGAVELFAYQEIRRIARELAKRYQDGLLAVLRQQRDRYETRLRGMSTTSEGLDRLKRLERSLSGWKAEGHEGIGP